MLFTESKQTDKRFWQRMKNKKQINVKKQNQLKLAYTFFYDDDPGWTTHSERVCSSPTFATNLKRLFCT